LGDSLDTGRALETAVFSECFGSGTNKDYIYTLKNKDMAKNKTTFGAVSQPTPQWAKWLFRGTLVVTSVATFIISGDDAIPMETKVRIGVYLKGLDLLVFGFSKMWGIEIEEKK
jgi:hypothetical protein